MLKNFGAFLLDFAKETTLYHAKLFAFCLAVPLAASTLSRLVIPEDYGTSSPQDVLARLGYDPHIADQFTDIRDIVVYDNTTEGDWAKFRNYDYVMLVKSDPAAATRGRLCGVTMYDDNFSARNTYARRHQISPELMEIPRSVDRPWRFLVLVHEFQHCAQDIRYAPFDYTLKLSHEIDADIIAREIGVSQNDADLNLAIEYYEHIRSFDNMLVNVRLFNDNRIGRYLKHATALGLDEEFNVSAQDIMDAHVEMIPLLIERVDVEGDTQLFLQVYDVAQDLLASGSPDLTALQQEILHKYIESVEFITPTALKRHLDQKAVLLPVPEI